MNDNARLCDHEKFEVLTALVHTGTLTASEWSELKNHLPTCEDCQQACSEYQIVVREGMPLLAAVHSHPDETVWQDIPAPTELLLRVRAARGSVFRDIAGLMSWPRLGHSLFRLTLAACFTLAVGTITYRMGSRTRFQAKEPATYITLAASNASEETKKVTDELVSANSERVAEREREIAQQAQKLFTLQEAMRTLTDRANQLALSKSEMGGQLQLILQQRDELSARLHDAEQSLRTAEVELENVQVERDKAVSRAASEETKVDELSAANLDIQRQLRNSEQYLDSDRDIRELMGARNLYIADVFDVDSSSRTRKPFGRVFYTQGKSLIFYAFDLDRQPEVKTANAFQAWGRRESNQAKPLNLGILYMDNESNRRWVLRFDNPGELAEIDAVFVTIEPRGGSPKPTGKPFLYASLRKEVNHP